MVVQGRSTSSCISSCSRNVSIICTISALCISAHWSKIILLRVHLVNGVKNLVPIHLYLMLLGIIYLEENLENKRKNLPEGNVKLQNHQKNLPLVLLGQQLLQNLPAHVYHPSSCPQSLYNQKQIEFYDHHITLIRTKAPKIQSTEGKHDQYKQMD